MTQRNRKTALGMIPEAVQNRGNATRMTQDDSPAITVTLEKINGILVDYLKNTIKPTIVENEQVKEVPILYGTAERWAAVRRDGFLRAEADPKLLAPLLMIRRTNVRRGSLMNPVNKYMYTSMEDGWTPTNAYDKYAALNRVTPSRTMRQIMIPDYMDLTYEVLLWTEYQEQMDMLIEQINVESDEFWGNRNNYKFRVSIDEFQSQADLPATGDRVIRTSFTMKVGAYLLPERIVKNGRMSSSELKQLTVKKTVILAEVDRTGK